jgi:HAD superfamily hydrolase (TIGR01484 family)
MKFIIFDIDGVLASHNEPIPLNVVKFLQDISSRAQIGFASGKTSAYLEGLARGLGLENVLIIGENGGVVFFPAHKEEILFAVSPVSRDEMNLVRKQILQQSQGQLWEQNNKIMLTFFPRQPLTPDDLALTARGILEKNQLRDLLSVVHPDAIDILPAHLNKGWGIDILVNRLKIDKADLIAVGNDVNDIAMFERAGTSICIGHNREISHRADATFSSILDAEPLINDLIGKG